MTSRHAHTLAALAGDFALWADAVARDMHERSVGLPAKERERRRMVAVRHIYYSRCELLHRAEELPADIRAAMRPRINEQEAAFRAARAEIIHYTKQERARR